jgi:hypothetical protein
MASQKNIRVTATMEKTTIRFWDTDIIVFDFDNSKVILNTGGWNTKATLKSMNHHLSQFDHFPEPIKVVREKKQWFAIVDGIRKAFINDTVSIEIK